MLRRAKLRLKGDKHFRDCSVSTPKPHFIHHKIRVELNNTVDGYHIVQWECLKLLLCVVLPLAKVSNKHQEMDSGF